jgi:hypothetical protein
MTDRERLTVFVAVIVLFSPIIFFLILLGVILYGWLEMDLPLAVALVQLRDSQTFGTIAKLVIKKYGVPGVGIVVLLWGLSEAIASGIRKGLAQPQPPNRPGDR